MNKLTPVVWATLSLAATCAQAFDIDANGNTLSIYGVLDGSVYVMKTPGSGTSYGWASNDMTTSRLGFGVSRDLGNGLKIGGVLEQEVEFATGGSGDGVTIATQAAIGSQTGQFNRAANIYLGSTSWGEVRLGRQYAPSFSLAAASDVLGANSGGYANTWVYANLLNSVLITGAGGQNNYNLNASTDSPDIFVDGLAYTSPVFSGVQIKVFQSFGSNLQPTSGNVGHSFNDSGITDVTLKYTDGAFTLGLGEQLIRASTASYNGSALSNAQISASYQMGPTKIAAAYDDLAYDSAYKTSLGAAAPHDVHIWTVGVTHMLDQALRLGASYTSAQDAQTSGNGVKIFAVQLDYALAKEADLYVQMSNASNAGAAQVSGVYGSVLPNLTNGGSVNSVFAGARYKF